GLEGRKTRFRVEVFLPSKFRGLRGLPLGGVQGNTPVIAPLSNRQNNAIVIYSNFKIKDGTQICHLFLLY
ncbi:MAG TPA: hypothetical protein DCP61_06365, partial [Treponema sp.]|nr:hypothetical protein [Treponema sp.]